MLGIRCSLFDARSVPFNESRRYVHAQTRRGEAGNTNARRCDTSNCCKYHSNEHTTHESIQIQCARSTGYINPTPNGSVILGGSSFFEGGSGGGTGVRLASSACRSSTGLLLSVDALLGAGCAKAESRERPSSPLVTGRLSTRPNDPADSPNGAWLLVARVWVWAVQDEGSGSGDRTVLHGLSINTDGTFGFALTLAQGFDEAAANVLGLTATRTSPPPSFGLQADSSSRARSSPDVSPVLVPVPLVLPPRKSFDMPSYAPWTTDSAALAFEESLPHIDRTPTLVPAKTSGGLVCWRERDGEGGERRDDDASR